MKIPNVDIKEIIINIKLPTDYTKLSSYDRKRVREAYIKLQNNKCYYCHNKLDREPPKKVRDKRIFKDLFPKNFFINPVHLHHSHETNMTIGAVHSFCNAVLWQYHNE